MLTVHLRINDAATKQPTPVRLSVTGPGGEYYPPLGRLAEFAGGVGEDVGGNLKLGRDRFAYIDGACEIPLPAGVPLRVRATKGPEYRPLDETLTLGPGKMAVRLAVERWSDLAADGWMSGDSRSHFIPPHAALLEAAAEDVNLVHVLAKVHLQLMQDGNTHTTLPNVTAFSGQATALAAGPHAVAVGTFNHHPALGSLGLLHTHRVVFPLAFGEPFDTDDWSLCDWCDQSHRKNGLAVWCGAFRTSAGLIGGEALAAAVLGKIDALEFDATPRPQLLASYYRLLNAGVRLPLVGGSGKDSNRVPLGAMRTYARVAERTFAGWVEAVRAGRSFVTNGPLLTFEVGETARATARCATAFEKLEIVTDGRVIASGSAAAEAAVPADAGWLAARCVGGSSPLVPAAVNFAHTSPVFVGDRRDPAAVAAVTGWLAVVREWAETSGQYRDAKWRTQLVATCEAAIKKANGET